MDDLELDEGALYGEERSNLAEPSPADRLSMDGGSEYSDDDAETHVEIGGAFPRAVTPQLSTGSGSIDAIPENEVLDGSLPFRPSRVAVSTAITFGMQTQQAVNSDTIGGIRMGSSAPISIPGFKMKAASKESPQEPKAFPQTFVPPHMMGSVETSAFGFDMTGASPAAVLKKEKLRARNAILRSTGFLSNEQDYEGAQISTLAGGNVSVNRQPDSLRAGFSSLQSGGLKAAMEAKQQ